LNTAGITTSNKIKLAAVIKIRGKKIMKFMEMVVVVAAAAVARSCKDIVVAAVVVVFAGIAVAAAAF
jgi:hypothetical protein